MFTRYVLSPFHPHEGPPNGLFVAAYSLKEGLAISAADRPILEQTLVWFEKNLAEPPRFNRTKSKGYDRRSKVGLSWFKPSATTHLENAEKLACLVAGYLRAVKVITTDRPGFVIFEDEHQLVAQPFRDIQLCSILDVRGSNAKARPSD